MGGFKQGDRSRNFLSFWEMPEAGRWQRSYKWAKGTRWSFPNWQLVSLFLLRFTTVWLHVERAFSAFYLAKMVWLISDYRKSLNCNLQFVLFFFIPTIFFSGCHWKQFKILQHFRVKEQEYFFFFYRETDSSSFSGGLPLWKKRTFIFSYMFSFFSLESHFSSIAFFMRPIQNQGHLKKNENTLNQPKTAMINVCNISVQCSESKRS